METDDTNNDNWVKNKIEKQMGNTRCIFFFLLSKQIKTKQGTHLINHITDHKYTCNILVFYKQNAYKLTQGENP